MSGFKVQLGEEEYRIVGPGGEEGDLYDYGEMAELECGGKKYIALVDQDDDGEFESLIGDWVYEVHPCSATTEDVDFDLGEQEEEEEEEPEGSLQP